MSASQYTLVALCLAMLLNERMRGGAVVMLLSSLFYVVAVLNLEFVYYYAATASIELLVFVALMRGYFLASLCSIALMFVNFYGFALCYNFEQPDNYDNISLLILIIQILLIASKGLPNGVSLRGCIKHWLVFLPDINGGK